MNYYFITGSSSGIGKALTEELLKYPNNYIIGLSRTNYIADKQFEHRHLDLSKPDEVESFKFEELQHAKKIVLVNNAGTLGDIEHVGNQSSQNIKDSIMVNFAAPAILMNKFIKSYKAFEGERIIINLSSGAADSAYDGWANYCSSKAALNMYTKVIHEEQALKSSPIKIFAIAPGVVDTVMQETIRQVDEGAFSQKKKFKSLKENDELYKAQDVAKQLVKMIHDTSTIPSLISRIHLK